MDAPPFELGEAGWEFFAALDRALGAVRLNQLAAEGQVSPAVLFDDDGRQFMGWQYSSLVGLFAVMVMVAFASPRQRLRVCQRCGSPFFTSAYQTRYCHPRCKRAEAQQRRRHPQ